MYLKSIELQGFKSFPEKTVLEFKEGITVIIGPNGSGKSNIADAMRWVLGELSARSIRGTKMEDVIFNGSEGRKPSSFAQVSLTLDNSSKENRLNIEYDTVTVTRRYFRGGDSEYLINGKNCRLKDIHRLFMNTGIGREGYSVIGQGKIAEIISVKSEDRRNVFEEAAGITKYKASKNEAAKKLDATRENLTRLRDILSVLEGRIGPLEKDAEKAKRYLEIYGEKRGLDIALWLYDMTSLNDKIASLSGTYEIYQSDLELTTGKAEKLAAEADALLDALQQTKRETERQNSRRTSLQVQRSEADNAKAVAETQKTHLSEKLSTLQAQLEALYSDGETASAELETRRGALKANSEKNTLADSGVKCAEEKYNDITSQIDALGAEADELSAEIKRSGDEAIDLRIRLTVTDTAERTDSEKDGGLTESIAKRKESAAAYEAKLAAAGKTVEGYEKLAADAKAALEISEKQSAETAAKAEKLTSDKGALSVQREIDEGRAQTLARMEELFEGYAESTRYVMEQYKKGALKAKIYGPVSQLLNVPTQYTTAIEIALGAALQNIVVADEAGAKAAIYALKAANKGRTTFLPISTVKSNGFNLDMNRLRSSRGFIGVASELCEYDALYSGIVGNLLGRTAVFDNLDNATECARSFGFRLRAVTLDGQQINSGGSFTGGSYRSGSRVLSRSAEIEALRQKADAALTKIKEYDRELDGLKTRAAALRTDIYNAQTQKDVAAALLSQANSDFSVLSSQYNDEKSRIAELEDEKNGVVRKAEERRLQRQKDGERLNALNAEISERRESLARLDEKAAEYNERQREYRASLEKARIAAAEAAKDVASAEEAQRQAQNRLLELQNKYGQTKAELEAVKARLLTTNERGEASKDEVRAFDTELNEVSSLIESLIKQTEDAERRLTSARSAEREETDRKEKLIMQTAKSKAALETAQTDRDKLKAALEENYELTYSEAKEQAEKEELPAVTPDTRPALVKRQTELKGRIRVLGHVNVGAVDEYKEVKEQYDFMSSQIADLSKSEEELLEIVGKLDEEMKVSFTQAFEAINERFGQVFVRLFGGGTAQLVLSEPDNVLESGIEINVAPPGKIIKNLSMLSGGEQSFIAIAIYFALIEVNPTPFIMLDEIEAALDEVNVARFAEYIKETQDRTQFILITHRRGTMEAAEKLYGVTMPVKGVSKVLSVDVNEIEEKVGKLE